jgi:ribosomal protein S12 methylthiotransferase accessory factor
MPDLERSSRLEELLTLVSPRVGVIRSLERLGRGIAHPGLPAVYRAVLAHFDFRPARLLDRAATGHGETEDDAKVAAVGEAIKLYCACHPDADRMHQATYKELGARAFGPDELVLYSGSQYASESFPFARFDEDAPIAWVAARSLPEGDDIHIPASLVYLNYRYQNHKEYLAEPTPNGLAAGPDLPAAVMGGLLEVVARDAFLIHWSNRLPAPRVDLRGLGGVSGLITEHLRRLGVDLFAFNLTTDLPIPVMMGLAIDHSGRSPVAAVGLSCGFAPAAALAESLMEMYCAYVTGSVQAGLEREKTGALALEDVREPDDHRAYFSSEPALAEFEFLLAGDRMQRIEEVTSHLPCDLDACAGLLARAGIRVAYFDVTTPDIRPLGLWVARTVAGRLQPLHFGYGRERRGGPRLYEVPCVLGFSERVRTEPELNPCPHPLI